MFATRTTTHEFSFCLGGEDGVLLQGTEDRFSLILPFSAQEQFIKKYILGYPAIRGSGGHKKAGLKSRGHIHTAPCGQVT